MSAYETGPINGPRLYSLGTLGLIWLAYSVYLGTHKLTWHVMFFVFGKLFIMVWGHWVAVPQWSLDAWG